MSIFVMRTFSSKVYCSFVYSVSLPHLSEQQPQQMEKPASPRKGNRTSINPESVYISASTHHFNREVEISAARSSWLSTQPLLLQYLENASNHGSLTCIGVLGLVSYHAVHICMIFSNIFFKSDLSVAFQICLGLIHYSHSKMSKTLVQTDLFRPSFSCSL